MCVCSSPLSRRARAERMCKGESFTHPQRGSNFAKLCFVYPLCCQAAVDASWKITEPEFAGATSKYSQLKAGALAAEASAAATRHPRAYSAYSTEHASSDLRGARTNALLWHANAGPAPTRCFGTVARRPRTNALLWHANAGPRERAILARQAAKFANDTVYMASQAAWADIAFNALKGGEVALEEAAKAKESRRRSTGKAGQWRQVALNKN